MPSPLILEATDASFVRNGSPTTAFGGGRYCDAGVYSDGEFNRTWLQYDMSSLPGTAIVDSANLAFRPFYSIFNSPYNNITMDVLLSGTGWSEGSITWNTQPSIFGSPLWQYEGLSSGNTESGDVTSSVVGQLLYGTQISFTVMTDGEDGSASASSFNVIGGRTANGGTSPPLLTIYYHLPTPPSTGGDNIWMGMGV